jgi:Ca2+-binding RTX toxin-like protein
MHHKSKNTRRSTRKSHNATQQYSSLEPRKLLASITAQGSTLTIDGSFGDDVIRVNRINGDTLVARLTTPTTTLYETFNWGSINSISVTGRNGNDFFNNGTDLKSTFYGHGGDDVGFGGRAADTFFGGSGDDIFYGRQGNDQALGGAGSDRLFGFDGNDILDGQNGDDFVAGGFGNDELVGGDGNDRLIGYVGHDTISGGAGNDYLAGGDGIDEIFGGDGNDVLRGGNDADTLWGGFGSDLILADDGNDISHGGQGIDYIFDLAGEESLIFGDQGNDVLRGGSGSDEIYGGDGNDRIFGGDGNDSLYGGANADLLNGGRGRDGLFGGVGAADRLIGGGDDDRFAVSVDQNLKAAGVSDVVVDGSRQDAVLSFVSNLEIQTELIYQAGSWSDAEIVVVDQALRNLHLEVSDTRLLKLAGGQNLSILRSGDVRTSTGAPILGLNFNDNNRIALTDNLFEGSPERIRETVYHEIAHNFDTVEENSFIPAFRAISNWDQVENFGDRLSLDGQWYYNDGFDNFLRAYARTNPLEDFAVTFAEHFQTKYEGFQRAFVNPVEKFSNIEMFLRS